MHSSHKTSLRRRFGAAACAIFFACVAAGCHRNNQNSGYGVGWVTLTDEPGDFAAYQVTVDSVVLTGATVGAISAVAVPEVVDFTQLRDISELWSGTGIPNDTYTMATITLDYTAANVAVMINGMPTKATVIDPSTGVAATTISINVTFDPNNRLVILPTSASTDAQRLAFDFDLPASNIVDLSTATPTVTIRPFFTVSTSAADTKLIRVRGPQVNSNMNYGTYSVYIRPFYDEVNNVGTLSLFTDANTIFTLNGTTYVGQPGIGALSQSSTGATVTAAYTTFEPTATLNASITAGIFKPVYVVAGSTLEDFYTEGLEGDVIARNGDTLTLRGSTLVLNAAQSVTYNEADANVLLGPGTIVTADGVAGLTNLSSASIAVGQHIVARGIYTLPNGVVTLDATGASAVNTGSVRLVSTSLFGSLQSEAMGSAVIGLQAINDYPVGVYSFAGNGASAGQDSNPANYVVNTGSIALPPGLAAGDPVFITGFTNAFGSAPPDFNAQTVLAESAQPATLQATWSGTGTAAPFASLTDTSFTIDLSNAAFAGGVIRIGAESINVATLAQTPQVVAQAPPAATPGLPAVFLPRFSVGSATGGISVFNTYTAFETQLNSLFTAATPSDVLFLDARGTYDRAANTFTAATVNVVL